MSLSKSTEINGHWLPRSWWQIALGIRSRIDSTVWRINWRKCKSVWRRKRYLTSRLRLERSSRPRQLPRSIMKIFRRTKSMSNLAGVAMEICFSTVWLRSRTVCRISRKSRQVAHPIQKVTVVSGERTAWKMVGRQVSETLARARVSSTWRIRSRLKTVAPRTKTTPRSTRWSSVSLALWEENNWR